MLPSYIFLEGKSGLFIVALAFDYTELDVEAENFWNAPKQTIELYQFQGLPMKVKRITDTSKTSIFLREM